MAGSPLANLKNGAKAFIDIISEATGGAQDGLIGSDSRIGIVSFASTAVQDTQLITSVSDLKAAVDALSSGGNTNHADAFTKASELLTPPSTNAKVMVMFTDGKTTTGPNPSPIAAAARADGVVSPCFRITGVSMPTKGTASLLDNTSVQWKIDELGVSQSEGAVLQFTVKHVGPCSGTVEVNESIIYSDTEGNVVSFPSPELDVTVRNIKFVLPEDLDVSGSPCSICNESAVT